MRRRYCTVRAKDFQQFYSRSPLTQRDTARDMAWDTATGKSQLKLQSVLQFKLLMMGLSFKLYRNLSY